MTENLFGEMAKADEGFDKFDPRNVAQLVTFLATDEAADISGQNFVVYGGDIWAMGGFHPSARSTATRCGRRPSWPRPRASCSRTSRRACRPSAWPEHDQPWTGPGRGRSGPGTVVPSVVGQPREGTLAVASPTTFSSPSALPSRTSRSTRWSPPSVRLPVTTMA